MRRTDEQKKAALQQRIATLREKVRRIERPDDKPVVALLERLKAAGESTEAAQ